jgi:hypothetical protein
MTIAMLRIVCRENLLHTAPPQNSESNAFDMFLTLLLLKTDVTVLTFEGEDESKSNNGNTSST